MNPIQFVAEIGADGVIRAPEGVKLPLGRVEVVVQQPAADPLASTRAWMSALVKEVEADPAFQHLPTDLAENHDHYAHGAPKR